MDAQASAKARRAGRRQNMIGPGSIVSGGLRRVVADKNRACAADVGKIILVNRQVFRSDAVDPLHRLLPRRCHQQVRIAADRLPRDDIALDLQLRLQPAHS